MAGVASLSRRMYARRARTALALACAYACFISPASAVAQSIGDEQYTDPFANQPQNKPPSQQAPTPQPTPAPTAPEPTTRSTGQPAQTVDAPVVAQPTASSEQLARTGVRAAPLATLGIVLLAGGVLLRLGSNRLSSPRRSRSGLSG
jgi:hypothetical protein